MRIKGKTIIWFAIFLPFALVYNYTTNRKVELWIEGVVDRIWDKMGTNF